MEAKFNQSFYKKLRDAIMDNAHDVEYQHNLEWYPDTLCVDKYEVDLNIKYVFESHDDSFDHAYGTWHDPCPYMEAVDFEDIEITFIYDTETDEGVDIEDFDYDELLNGR